MRRKIIFYKVLCSAVFFACLTKSAQAQMPGNQPPQPFGFPGQSNSYPQQPFGYPGQANAYPPQPNGYQGFPPQNPISHGPEPAENNNETDNPGVNPYKNSYGDLSTPHYDPDILIKGLPAAIKNNHILDAGTVLTGALQEDLSSKKSKAGDVFSIMLSDNYSMNNEILVPQNSKFIGSILSTMPAKKTRNGNPGSVQVSVQTLVTPDGTSVPVNAVIGYDPNQQRKRDVKKSRGVPLGEWATSAEYSVYYAVGTVGSRLGVPFLYKGQTHGGKEFILSKGQFLPVKLSQPVDITPLIGHNGAGSMTVPSGPVNSQINDTTNGSMNNLMNSPNNPSNMPSFSGNNSLPNNRSPAGPEPF